jgi:hypothetical protein
MNQGNEVIIQKYIKSFKIETQVPRTLLKNIKTKQRIIKVLQYNELFFNKYC